jgi:hypothetical protein
MHIRSERRVLKELKAIRLAVQTFMPHLASRNVHDLHEDTQAVCYIIARLTSRSPAMTELRKLLQLLDANMINVKARYIRSAANV